MKFVEYSKIRNEKIFRNALFFSRGDEELKSLIKSGVMNSESLWYTGIQGSTITGGLYGFLKLHRLRRRTQESEGLLWSKNEVKKLFNKLVKSFNNIERVKKSGDRIGFLGILQEMSKFLIDEEKNLKHLKRYQEIKGDVQFLYNQERGYCKIYDGLLSNNSAAVIWALNELSGEIYEESSIDIRPELSLILNKILLQSEPGLEASLDYIASWFTTRKDDKTFQSFSDILNQILVRYSVMEFNEMDKPYFQERLVKIARLLEYWNLQNEYIEKWLEEGKFSRFNNVKNLPLLTTTTK